jgi:calcineurin-like phosphoesterase family protein
MKSSEDWKNSMGDRWFTSDLHLGHENIIKYCNRPFKSVDEMDNVLIDNWNKVVKEFDTVYCLGDFCMKNRQKYLERLNGYTYFLKGSHDKDIAQPYMIAINSRLEDEYGNDRTIVLCHYAMRSWPLSHYASWHLFGHSHGKLESYGLSFDVGVDCWNFYPVSLEQVAEKMKTLTPIVDFRGKPKNE